jgi:hypothetical protein
MFTINIQYKTYPLLEALVLLLACFLGAALDHPRASNREVTVCDLLTFNHVSLRNCCHFHRHRPRRLLVSFHIPFQLPQSVLQLMTCPKEGRKRVCLFSSPRDLGRTNLLHPAQELQHLTLSITFRGMSVDESNQSVPWSYLKFDTSIVRYTSGGMSGLTHYLCIGPWLIVRRF